MKVRRACTSYGGDFDKVLFVLDSDTNKYYRLTDNSVD